MQEMHPKKKLSISDGLIYQKYLDVLFLLKDECCIHENHLAYHMQNNLQKDKTTSKKFNQQRKCTDLSMPALTLLFPQTPENFSFW